MELSTTLCCVGLIQSYSISGPSETLRVPGHDDDIDSHGQTTDSRGRQSRWFLFTCRLGQQTSSTIEVQLWTLAIRSLAKDVCEDALMLTSVLSLSINAYLLPERWQ